MNGKLKLVTLCSTRGNHENWVCGNRDSGQILKVVCDYSNLKILQMDGYGKHHIDQTQKDKYYIHSFIIGF